MDRALVRDMPDSFDQAIVGRETTIDVGLARAQHDEYGRRLAGAGYEVVVVPTDEAQPDCVFVEDMAVVLGGIVVATRSGAETRRGESVPVIDTLAQSFEVVSIVAPGTIDGGDVLVSGERVFVGLSKRTNREGAEQLADLAGPLGFDVVPVPVSGVLHLKSGVLPVDTETLVVTPGTVDEGLFTGCRVIYEVEEERHRFSALPLRNGTVLVTASAPRTAEAVASIGHIVDPIDVSQIQATDGGLTCLSILY